jgi:hypothetical protein
MIWAEVDAAVAEIVASATEPFDDRTVANARDFLNFARLHCPPPDDVMKGYWSTLCASWSTAEFEVFEDRVEVYPADSEPKDIWYEWHTAGEPFSPALLAALPHSKA